MFQRIFFTAFALSFILCGQALAQEELVQWQTSQTKVTESAPTFIITHQDQCIEEVRVRGLKLIPESSVLNTQENAGRVWNLILEGPVVESDDEQNKEASKENTSTTLEIAPIFRLKGTSQEKALDTLHAVSISRDTGIKELFLFHKEKNSSIFVIMLLRLEQQSDGFYTQTNIQVGPQKYIGPTSVESGGKFSADAIASLGSSARVEGGMQHSFLVLNKKVGMLSRFVVLETKQRTATAGEVSRLQAMRSSSGISSDMLLQADFNRRFLSDSRYLWFFDQEQLKLNLRGPDGTLVLENNLRRSFHEDDEESNKEGALEGVTWVSGFEKIKAHIEQKTKNAPAFSDQFFDNDLAKWTLEAQSREISDFNQSRYNVALISLSEPLLKEKPLSIENTILAFLNRLDLHRKGEIQKEPFLYLKFNGSMEKLDSFFQFILSNTFTDEVNTSKQFYAALDFSECDDKDLVALISSVLPKLSGEGSGRSLISKKGHFLIFGKQSSVAYTTEHSHLGNSTSWGHAAHYWSLDSALTKKERIEILAKHLGIGFETLMTASTIIEESEKNHSEETLVFNNLEIAAKLLQPFVLRLVLTANVDPDSPNFAKMLARSFIATIGFERREDFPETLKSDAAKLSTLVKGTAQILGLDDQIQQIRGMLLGYLSRGHSRGKPLVIAEMGDSGTGKSLTIDTVATVLGAAIETVNLAGAQDIDKFYERRNSPWGYKRSITSGSKFMDSIKGFEWKDFSNLSGTKHVSKLSTADIVSLIHQKVIELNMSPKPLKILVLDEANAGPEVLGQLQSSFGDTDSKTAGINFKGLVVVVIMNVNLESDAYKQLVQMNRKDEQYKQLIGKLFEKSFNESRNSSAKGEPKEIQMHAIQTRLLRGMILFPPSSKTANAKHRLFNAVIRTFERENPGLRLIVPKAVRDFVIKMASASEAANFRGLDSAMNDILDEIVGEFYAHHSDVRILNGRFQLTLHDKPTGKGTEKELALEPIKDSELGVRLEVRDTYLRFNDTITRALTTAIEALQDSEAKMRISDRASAEISGKNARALKLVLESFERASAKPFFPEELQSAQGKLEKPVGHRTGNTDVLRFVPPICLPECYTESKQAMTEQLFLKPLAALFEKFIADDHEQTFLHELAAVASFTRATLKKMDIRVSSENIPNSNFRKWLLQVSNMDQVGKSVDDTKQLVEAEKQFIKTHWENWQTLKEEMSKKHQIEREEAIFDLASTIEAEVQKLKEEMPSLLESSENIKPFVAALKGQKDREMEAIVKRVEKKSEDEEARAAGAAVQCTSALTYMDKGEIERTTGWLLADATRMAASLHLANLSHEQIKNREQKMYLDAPATPNAIPLSPEAQAIQDFHMQYVNGLEHLLK